MAKRSSRNKLAWNIERIRAQHRIETTGELVDIIEHSIQLPYIKRGPAKRIFQAIRWSCKWFKLAAIEDSLEQALKLLAWEAESVCILLEDRIVKQCLKQQSTVEKAPKNLPILPTEEKARSVNT